jgi:HNH endonuclease
VTYATTAELDHLPRTVDPGLAPCLCVTRHAPRARRHHVHHVWPLGEGGPNTPGNLVPLCPTSHEDVHVLLDLYREARKVPPWTERRRFNHYVRLIAHTGFWAIADGEVIPLSQMAGIVNYDGPLPDQTRRPGARR